MADVLLADGYFFQIYKDEGSFLPIDDLVKT